MAVEKVEGVAGIKCVGLRLVRGAWCCCCDEAGGKV